jgi:hypothetical protein
LGTERRASVDNVKTTIRILSWLLVLGGLAHSFGAWRAYSTQPVTLIWAWSGTLAALLLAALNLQRATRLDDVPLALICLGGSLAWAAVSFAFARAAGIPLDPRPMTHVVLGVALAATTLPTLVA